MSRISRFAIPFFTVGAACFSSVAPAIAGSSLETFVLSIGGLSTPAFPNPPPFACTIYGSAPSPVLNSFFGGGFGPILPIEGLTECSIAGGFRTTTSPMGSLSDSTSLSTTFGFNNVNTFTGSASAKASFGTVGAQANGVFGGPDQSSITVGSQSFGYFHESGMNPSINADAIILKFKVDGSLSTTSISSSFMKANYQINDSRIYPLMSARVDARVGSNFFVPTLGQVDGSGTLGGFTLTPRLLIGSDEFSTLSLPITPGSPFDLTFGLVVSALPGSDSSSTADFFATAQLSGIELFSGSIPITDFEITSDSGTVYGPNGVVTANGGANPDVPGPAPVLGVLAAYGWCRRLRHRITSGREMTGDST